MGRAIDADALRKRIKAKNASNAMMRAMKAECLAEIDDAPTIEPERKKGKWLDGYQYGYKCSECGAYLEIDCGDAEMNYCPTCGSYNGGEQE